MFGNYFISSFKALICLIVSPVICGTFNFLWIHSWIATKIHEEEGYLTYGESGSKIFLFIMLGAIVVNFIFLMIIPATVDCLDAGKKKIQFYVCFFINFFLVLVIPIVLTTSFHIIFIDKIAFWVLLGMHGWGFLLTFILASWFVSPAYARMFWFVDRINNNRFK